MSLMNHFDWCSVCIERLNPIKCAPQPDFTYGAIRPLVLSPLVFEQEVKALSAKAREMREGTFSQEKRREPEEGRRGRDMQHITWECQRVAPQPVPAKGPGAFFN